MIKKRADKRPTALGLLESLPESGGTPDGVACKYLRRRCNGGRDDLLRSDAGDIGSRYSVPMEDETDSAPIVAPPRVENKPVAPPRVENNPVAPPRVENKPKKTKLPSASPTEGNKPPVGKPPLAPKVVAPPRRDPSARPLAPPPPAPARGPPSPLTPSLKPYGSGGDEEQVAEEKEYLPSYLREDVNPRDVLRDPVIQQWTRIDRDNSSPPSSPTPSKPASERGGSSPRVYAPPRKNASIAFVQSPPDSGVMKDKGAEDGHDDPVLEGEVSDSIAEDLKAHAEERFTQATDIEEEDPMMKTFTGFGSALLPPKPENPKAPSSFSEHTSRGPILLQTGSREESQGEDDAVLEGAVSDSIAEDVKAHAEDRWTQEGEDKDPLMQTFTGFGSQAPLLPAKAESTDGPPSASSFLQIHAAAPALLQSSQAHSKEEGGGEDDAVLEGEVSDSIAEDVKQHAEDRWTQEGEVEDPLMQTFTGFDFSSLSNGS
uniref:Uncharacterized protein n=1 Tax=Chromera velia CCMP2878 TaxID=1169474 RepID=A0A0G4HEX6_9ALVE|eukprot:Cvel_26762.t1-p1 / transcript=Cvel_26762.t1 / gene=Cvel_26762 / organism=Chromera_velia_CCMP2878 / gene_product=hypothetical protein / transcript_product=hypothetical protein / location=Cvel_scaffold3235:2986-4443(-) / protein_length=486 / sequence_SO=supercontig / SO=protein_coding / is_pseudo=false